MRPFPHSWLRVLAWPGVVDAAWQRAEDPGVMSDLGSDGLWPKSVS
jgi:hypothetical protein